MNAVHPSLLPNIQAVVSHIFFLFQCGGNSSKPQVSVLQVMVACEPFRVLGFLGMFSCSNKFRSGFVIFKMFYIIFVDKQKRI